MTPKKKESALGRGLDALIRPDFNDKKNDEDAEISESRSVVNTPVNSNPKNSSRSPKKHDINSISKQSRIVEDKSSYVIEKGMVENVILEVHKNPRISLWSAKSAAVLRLLKKTKPEFSISKEASSLIEEAVKNKYPNLWEVFEDKDL